MFRGLRRTALAILTLALILTFPVTASATDAGFSDVPETAPYHDSVVYLSERQIVTGTGVGQFSPDAPITVRQWAVMLCRAYGVQMKGNGWMEQSQSGVDAAYGNGWLSETAVVSPETQLCRSAVLESAFDAAQIPVYDNVLYGGKALSREENVLRVGQELGLCSASSTVGERVTRGEAAVYLYETLTHQFVVEAPKSPVVCENRSDANLNDYLMMFDPDSRTPEEQPCVGPYMTFKQSSPNLRGNLIVNLAADIGVMDDAKVRTLLSTPCIDMSLPGKQPCAYFCIFPDSHDTYKFIVSLFFSMLFITLINDADNNGKDRKLDVPVDFLLDEFPSIGTIPDFDRKMATIRKRAMNVCMIFQDITQLQNNYQTTWATLLSNCSTLVSLGINDEFTAKMVSSRIGDTTVNVRTNQHKAMETLLKNNEFLHNWSSGEGKRALVGLDEAFKMGKNDSIIIFQGHNPILAKKYPHTLHTDAKKLSNFDFREIPPITDKEGRELFYQRQQNILDTFNITHPHINEVDRSYTGMCNSIPVQSIWEESKDAVIAYVKEINKKGSDDDVIEVEDCGDEYIEVDETDEEQAVEPSAPPAQQEPVLSVDAKPNADIDLEIAEDETEPQQEDISKPKEAPTPAEAKDVAQGGKRPAPPKRSFSSTPTTGKPRMSGKLPGMR